MVNFKEEESFKLYLDKTIYSILHDRFNGKLNSMAPLDSSVSMFYDSLEFLRLYSEQAEFYGAISKDEFKTMDLSIRKLILCTELIEKFVLSEKTRHHIASIKDEVADEMAPICEKMTRFAESNDFSDILNLQLDRSSYSSTSKYESWFEEDEKTLKTREMFLKYFNQVELKPQEEYLHNYFKHRFKEHQERLRDLSSQVSEKIDYLIHEKMKKEYIDPDSTYYEESNDFVIESPFKKPKIGRLVMDHPMGQAVGVNSVRRGRYVPSSSYYENQSRERSPSSVALKRKQPEETKKENEEEENSSDSRWPGFIKNICKLSIAGILGLGVWYGITDMTSFLSNIQSLIPSSINNINPLSYGKNLLDLLNHLISIPLIPNVLYGLSYGSKIFQNAVLKTVIKNLNSINLLLGSKNLNEKDKIFLTQEKKKMDVFYRNFMSKRAFTYNVDDKDEREKLLQELDAETVSNAAAFTVVFAESINMGQYFQEIAKKTASATALILMDFKTSITMFSRVAFFEPIVYEPFDVSEKEMLSLPIAPYWSEITDYSKQVDSTGIMNGTMFVAAIGPQLLNKYNVNTNISSSELLENLEKQVVKCDGTNYMISTPPLWLYSESNLKTLSDFLTCKKLEFFKILETATSDFPSEYTVLDGVEVNDSSNKFKLNLMNTHSKYESGTDFDSPEYVKRIESFLNKKGFLSREDINFDFYYKGIKIKEDLIEIMEANDDNANMFKSSYNALGEMMFLNNNKFPLEYATPYIMFVHSSQLYLSMSKIIAADSKKEKVKIARDNMKETKKRIIEASKNMSKDSYYILKEIAEKSDKIFKNESNLKEIKKKVLEVVTNAVNKSSFFKKMNEDFIRSTIYDLYTIAWLDKEVTFERVVKTIANSIHLSKEGRNYYFWSDPKPPGDESELESVVSDQMSIAVSETFFFQGVYDSFFRQQALIARKSILLGKDEVDFKNWRNRMQTLVQITNDYIKSYKSNNNINTGSNKNNIPELSKLSEQKFNVDKLDSLEKIWNMAQNLLIEASKVQSELTLASDNGGFNISPEALKIKAYNDVIIQSCMQTIQQFSFLVHQIRDYESTDFPKVNQVIENYEKIVNGDTWKKLPETKGGQKPAIAINPPSFIERFQNVIKKNAWSIICGTISTFILANGHYMIGSFFAMQTLKLVLDESTIRRGLQTLVANGMEYLTSACTWYSIRNLQNSDTFKDVIEGKIVGEAIKTAMKPYLANSDKNFIIEFTNENLSSVVDKGLNIAASYNIIDIAFKNITNKSIHKYVYENLTWEKFKSIFTPTIGINLGSLSSLFGKHIPQVNPFYDSVTHVDGETVKVWMYMKSIAAALRASTKFKLEMNEFKKYKHLGKANRNGYTRKKWAYWGSFALVTSAFAYMNSTQQSTDIYTLLQNTGTDYNLEFTLGYSVYKEYGADSLIANFIMGYITYTVSSWIYPKSFEETLTEEIKSEFPYYEISEKVENFYSIHKKAKFNKIMYGLMIDEEVKKIINKEKERGLSKKEKETLDQEIKNERDSFHSRQQLISLYQSIYEVIEKRKEEEEEEKKKSNKYVKKELSFKDHLKYIFDKGKRVSPSVNIAFNDEKFTNEADKITSVMSYTYDYLIKKQLIGEKYYVKGKISTTLELGKEILISIVNKIFPIGIAESSWNYMTIALRTALTVVIGFIMYNSGIFPASSSYIDFLIYVGVSANVVKDFVSVIDLWTSNYVFNFSTIISLAFSFISSRSLLIPSINV
jgi:hypothetical protein